MKVQSNEKLPLIVYELKTNMLNFNEVEKGEGLYEYDSFRVDKSMSFDKVVVAMIRDRYDENDEAKYNRWHLEASYLKTKTLSEEEVNELIAYTEYIAWCHEAAKQIWQQ